MFFPEYHKIFVVGKPVIYVRMFWSRGQFSEFREQCMKFLKDQRPLIVSAP